MPARPRRRLVIVAALVIAGMAAACAPVAAPPPPPPAPPAPSPPPPPPATNTCSGPIVTDDGSTQFFEVVEDGDGDAPEAVTFEAATEGEKQAEIAQIEATEGDVVTVEPDQLVTVTDQDPNTDPDYAANRQWGVGAAGFPTAWGPTNANSRGAGTTIAILDTGVLASHQDLTGGVINGVDHVGGVPNATTDPHGHGTHVAGIAGARDNTIGGVGAAPDVTIYPVRVLGDTGAGSYSSVINGINSAIAQGVDVISMSLGGSGYSQAMQDAVTNAVNADIVVVAAAGNSSSCNAQYPAKLIGVIGVAATDDPGTALSSFSERGPDVDIAAPGRTIWSTLNTGSYDNMSGTSMATPFVSAAAALLLSCGVAPANVESALEDTVSPPIANIQPDSGALRADLATAAACP